MLGNPQLGALTQLLEAPDRADVCPQTVERRPEREPASDGQVGAQLRPDRADGRASRSPASGCCSSCGSRSAARSRSSRRATGSTRRSPRPRSSPRRPTCGSPACPSARSEGDRGRRGGPGRSLVTMELDAQYSPLPSRRPGAAAPEDAAGGDLRGAHARAATAPSRCPEGGRLDEGQVSETVELDEILRTFDPATRAAFQEWMQTQAEAIAGHGRDLNDALGNLGPFAEDAAVLVDILNRQEPAVRAADRRHRRRVRGADRARRAAARADRELQPGVRGDGRARPRAAGGVPGAADVRARVARDGRAAGAVRARRPTRWSSQLRPAARELSPTLTDLSALAPDLEALFRDLDPLITASERGFPAAERILEDLRPLLGQLDPALRQLNPVLDYLGLYRRELTGFFANTVAATQATTRTPRGPIHYLRTTNPFSPENLCRRLRAAALQPHERVRAARASSTSCATGLPSLRDAPLRPRRRADDHQRADAGRAGPAAAARALASRSSGRRPVPDAGVVDGTFELPDALFARHPALRVPGRRRERAARAALPQQAARPRVDGRDDASYPRDASRGEMTRRPASSSG